MKQHIPALFPLLAIFMTACDDTQSMSSFEDDPLHLTMNLRIDGNAKGKWDIFDLESQSVESAYGTTKGIAVSDIIAQIMNVDDATLDALLSSHQCEYQSNIDGFKPSDKGERCPQVSCELTRHTFINPNTGTIFFDASVALTNGCYQVKNVADDIAAMKTPSYEAQVLMTTADPNAHILWVYQSDTSLGIPVDVGNLQETQIAGKNAIKITDIFDAAAIEFDPNTMNCDVRLVGDASIVSSTHSSCPLVAGENAQNLYLLKDTWKLADDAGKIDDCYSANAVQALYAFPKNSEILPYTLTLSVDGTTYEIDLTTLQDKSFIQNGLPVITLSELVSAVGLDLNLNDFWCDYQGADGFMPHDRDRCAEIYSCEKLKDSTLTLLNEHKMKMKDAESCYNVTELVTIFMTSKSEK